MEKSKEGVSLSTALKEAEHYLLQNDPVLGEIISRMGPCTITPRENYFEALVRSIIGQQLSAKVAARIYIKFLISVEHSLSPEKVLLLTEEQLKASGISKQKASFIRNIAEAFISNKDFFTNLKELPDEEVLGELTKIKGIGLWTAQIFLIFSLNRLNVLPLGDAGFRRSVALHYKIDKPTNDQLVALSDKWGSYSSVAVWYLWRSLDSL